MEVVNNSRYPCQVIQTIMADRKRYAVVMVKATYAFPAENDARPRPADEQRPILISDRFEGEPGLSTPLEESDVGPEKPRCDVIVNACVYAENDTPVRSQLAAIKVGDMEKRIEAVGDRVWKDGLLGLTPSNPKPFTRMPVLYSRAFGGTWEDEQREEVVVCEQNPVGCGFAKGRFVKHLAGTPVPNLSEPGKAISNHSGKHRPVAFGPIGRSWQPRVRHAGTYDDHWTKNVFPLPPKDLDPRFYQSAPLDQQIDHPNGGETVALWNLHPERALIRFALPALTLPIHVVGKTYDVKALEPVVDTISIDAEAGVFTLLWRARYPINRSLREIDALVIGHGFRLWFGERIGASGCCGDDDDRQTAPESAAELPPVIATSTQQAPHE